MLERVVLENVGKMLPGDRAMLLSCVVENLVHLFDSFLATFSVLVAVPEHVLGGVAMFLVTVRASIRVDKFSGARSVSRSNCSCKTESKVFLRCLSVA